MKELHLLITRTQAALNAAINYKQYTIDVFEAIKEEAEAHDHAATRSRLFEFQAFLGGLDYLCETLLEVMDPALPDCDLIRDYQEYLRSLLEQAA